MLLGVELGILAGQVTYARVPLEIRKKIQEFQIWIFQQNDRDIASY